jgi:hypothetical protein
LIPDPVFRRQLQVGYSLCHQGIPS